MSGKGRSKYGAVKTVCGVGHKHDSKKEAKACDDLTLMAKCGAIDDLKVQVPYSLFACNGKRAVKVCEYIADFTYMDNGALVVLDVKGVKTAMYRLKKKMMLACWGIEVRES